MKHVSSKDSKIIVIADIEMEWTIRIRADGSFTRGSHAMVQILLIACVIARRNTIHARIEQRKLKKKITIKK